MPTQRVCWPNNTCPNNRVLDIVAPEVFVSYNWGVRLNKGYSTQEMVLALQPRLELETGDEMLHFTW